MIELIKELISLPKELDLESGYYESEEDLDQGLRPRGAVAAAEPVEDRLDEYEHFGNRRLRTVGELIQEAFRIGSYRMERGPRAPHHRGRGHDHAARSSTSGRSWLR